MYMYVYYILCTGLTSAISGNELKILFASFQHVNFTFKSCGNIIFPMLPYISIIRTITNQFK